MTTAEQTVCVVGNIGRKGQQRRVAAGVLGALVALGGLWLTPAGGARIWLFLPLMLAVVGFAQAQQRT